METTDAFIGLACRDCATVVEPETGTHRCPDCGGILDPAYDYDVVDLDPKTLTDRSFDSLWRYEELLPFPRRSAVTIVEGATPLIECPTLAEELGVDRVFLKDDGRNPTGSLADRGASIAVTAAGQHGATDVALPSTGAGGQAAAAYAGRAGLESHVFLPARSSHTAKAMVNVHGGDMTVSGGRITETNAAFDDAMAEHDDWYTLSPFDTPYRHEGAKTALFEVVEQLGWTVPDAIVYPTGSGTGLIGAYKGATELCELGLIEDRPALYAAQAAGCSPIVDAFEAERDAHDLIEYPDTICGGIEVPDPTASPWILEAIRETDGGAVASDDDQILEAAVAVAQHEGQAVAPTPAAALSGAWNLAERDVFGGDETVVLVNTDAAHKEADVLRSHLMGRGI